MSEGPSYIYKILPESWTVADPLPESLATTDLDKNSGFIHMSTASQIPNTLKFFFPVSSDNANAVFILRVPYAPLAEKGMLRWEDPKAQVCGSRDGEGMFPHIYDDKQYKLGKDEVESWRKIVSEVGESDWLSALQKYSDWLV